MSAALMRLFGGAAVLAAALAACNGDDDPVAPTPTATVYAVHGIPGVNLEPVNSTPVDVLIGDDCVANDMTYGDVSDAITVDAGSYTVEFRDAAAQSACGGTVVASANNVQVGANQNLSIVAHLNTQAQARVTRFENDRSAAQGPRVVARHLAAFGAVDVWLDDEVLFENLANGDQEAAVVTAGTHDVTVTEAGGVDPLFTAAAPFQNNVVYIAYAVGSPANETFHVIVQTLTMQP